MKKHTSTLLALLGTSLLAACAALKPPPPLAVHELGQPPVVAAQPLLPSFNISVNAPSWLMSNAMQYRLLHEPPARRQFYAHNRWAGNPAELLQRYLIQALGAPAAASQTCLLRIDLDEFSQDFSDAQSSQARLDVRAAVYLQYEDTPVSQQVFSLTGASAAPGPLAGVSAHRLLAADLAAALTQWLQNSDAPEACAP